MSGHHAAEPHDAEASLRDELTTKIAGAQAEIENKLSDLRNALGSVAGGNAITQAEAQLRGLALLQKRVDHASPASLAAIRGEVAASIAATQAFVQQMQGAGSTVTAEKAALQQASEAARGSVNDFLHDYYDQKKFDRFLQFASVEDEQEYRRREEERKHAIDKAMAEHTPEGDLLANKLAIEQLKDAGVHGADKSPEFQKRMDALTSSNGELASALAASPASAATAATDPLDAAKPTAQVSPDLLAKVRASGVVVADQNGSGHGVAMTPSPSAQSRG